MRLDLIEVEPKLNKVKVVVCMFIGLAIVAICSILAVHVAESYYEKQLAKQQVSEEMQQEIATESQDGAQQEGIIEEQTVIAETKQLPVYTQEAQEYISNIYKQQEKVVYLTFDDGPSKTVTPLILDLLKEENIKATFFVLGSRVELYPELVKREYEEGHYIANHGYSHTYSSIYQSVDTILEEYNSTKEAIKVALDEPEYDGHLFRYPGGSVGGKYKQVKAEAKPILQENEIAYLDWNALTSDAAGAKTKEAMMESLSQDIDEKNTVVVLMHDAGDKILTYEVLPEVIQFFRDRGYTFGDMYHIMRETDTNNETNTNNEEN